MRVCLSLEIVDCRRDTVLRSVDTSHCTDQNDSLEGATRRKWVREEDRKAREKRQSKANCSSWAGIYTSHAKMSSAISEIPSRLFAMPPLSSMLLPLHSALPLHHLRHSSVLSSSKLLSLSLSLYLAYSELIATRYPQRDATSSWHGVLKISEKVCIVLCNMNTRAQSDFGEGKSFGFISIFILVKLISFACIVRMLDWW